MSQKSNTCDESMLSYEMFSYLSDFFVETENNDLNFDKFIRDCKMISPKSCQNTYKDFSDIGDSPISYDVDKYVIEHTPVKILKNSQNSFPHAYMIRKNENEQDKNNESYTHSEISKPISVAVNISSSLLLEEFANLNWHISLMNIMEMN